MAVRFTILGSGSSGNCAYLETDETRVLIDAGLSGRQIRQRLLSIGRSPENLTGVLITHEHSDHTQGLIGLAKLNLPIYCNRLTGDAIAKQLKSKPNLRLFETGGRFEVGEMIVDSFSVPHDAYDPVGFVVQTACGDFGFLTDLGHATKLAVERVRRVNVLVLEANYDVKLLQEDTRRPWSTKQRIMSRHGHLSNDDAADLAGQIISDQLRHLYLAHLSSDCNRPQLAHQIMACSLEKLGSTRVSITTAAQTSPCPTLTVTDGSGNK